MSRSRWGRLPVRAGDSAFSLIELLVVMAILGILTVLVAPAVQSVLAGRNVGTAAEMITAGLQSARQAAITRNALVQWQLLRVPDRRNGDTQAFRLTRSLILTPGTREWQSLDPPEWLPVGAWVSTNTSESPLLSNPTSATNLPGSLVSGGSAIAATIIFNAAGRANVDVSQNWLTVVSRANTNDFLTIQLDPTSGRVRTFRPGL